MNKCEYCNKEVKNYWTQLDPASVDKPRDIIYCKTDECGKKAQDYIMSYFAKLNE